MIAFIRKIARYSFSIGTKTWHLDNREEEDGTVNYDWWWLLLGCLFFDWELLHHKMLFVDYSSKVEVDDYKYEKNEKERGENL